jgi:protein phosphatase 1 regulatory subunit 37
MADLETDKTAVVDTLTKESKVLEEPQVLLPEDSVDEKALLLVKSDQVDDTAQDTKVKSNEDSPDKESDVKIAPSPHRKIVRPKKGILKPPRPPVKPGFSGKLRDALGSIHPKFLDYAVPGGSGQVAAAAHGIAAGPVGNIASGVMEGAGVIGGAVGGAAAAVVGSWGGRFGKFVSGTSAQPNNATGATISPIQLPWKFQVPSANTKNVTTSDKPISVESSPAKPTTVPLSFTLASPSAPLPLDGTKPLKKASFILPLMSITYPISATNAPWSDKVLSDRDEIERTKNEEVKMIGAKDYWTEQKLIALYESACKGREEMVRSGIREALAVSFSHKRNVDDC